MNTDPHSLLDQLRGELDALRSQVSAIQTHLDELEQALDAPVPSPVEEEAVDLSDVSFDALPEVGSADEERVGEQSPQKDSAPQASLRPLPQSAASFSQSKDSQASLQPSSFDNNLHLAGPSPCPCPGVDRPSEGSALQPDLSPSAEPKPVAPEKPSPKAVVRESTDRYAWRKDMPGAQVRDIRSAIALNDRVLFINTLFQQDAVRFQNTLNALNMLESLPEAEDYLQRNFPQWNLDSEVVYRFMMAVRRKLR